MEEHIAREIETLKAAVRAHRRTPLTRQRTRMRLDEIERRLAGLEALIAVLYRIAPLIRKP